MGGCLISSFHLALFTYVCKKKLIVFLCFACRFESKHSYFKKLYRILRSVKDLVGTLSRYHQRHQAALMMLSDKGYEGPFLARASSFSVPVQKLLKTIPSDHQKLLSSVFGGVTSNTSIEVYKTCTEDGVKYRRNTLIITQFTDTLPVFGEVTAIYRHQQEAALVFKSMKTFSYERDLKAFKVGYVLGLDRFGIIPMSNLVHRHPLHVVRSSAAVYVSVPCKSFK